MYHKISVGDPNPKGSERFVGSESKSESDQTIRIRNRDPKGSEGKFYVGKHVYKGEINIFLTFFGRKIKEFEILKNFSLKRLPLRPKNMTGTKN